MDKQALSKFAPGERRRLREAVQKRLAILGITEKSKFNAIQEWLIEQDGIIVVNNKSYTDYKRSTFEQLFKEYQQVGYDTLVEEIAYTWFNRLIAIRYMEVRDVLPDYVKILGNNGISNQPEILNDYSYLLVDKAEIEFLKMNNQEEAAYRKLFLAAANKLGDVMPFLFEKLQDWTELVLPERMLEPGGIIERIVTNEGLTKSFQDGVEAIGWLYQYYISEVKDKVMKLKKVTKEQLPARTQLFTPKWIVQYMVENSLGAIWLQSNPESIIKTNMNYYVDPAEQSEEVNTELEEIRYKGINNLEEITFLDPAVGSGHILLYAYDLFYSMYQEYGYSKREIPSLILEKNLFGIDIDDRAAQLSSFTLAMKAAESSGRTYWRNPVNPNVVSIQQSNTIDLTYIQQLFSGQQLETVQRLINNFFDAKEYGSLICPERLDLREIERLFESGTLEKNNVQFSLFDASHAPIVDASGQVELLQKLINQQRLLENQYSVVVTNPPYMSNGSMNMKLAAYAKKHYFDAKSDMFAMFIERNNKFANKEGLIATVNPHSWMFLPTYETLRKKIIANNTIDSLIHLGPRAFEDIGGEVVQTVAYVLRKSFIKEYKAKYRNLSSYSSAVEKEKMMNSGKDEYITDSSKYSLIPGNPIAYAASNEIINSFINNSKMEDVYNVGVGIQTSDNDRFLRYWNEVSLTRLCLSCGDSKTAVQSKKKWFPFNKGGSFRKWYGNLEYVINWENDGEELKKFASNLYGSYSRTLRNLNWMFKSVATFSKVSSGLPAVRYMEKGTLFSDAGPVIFNESDEETLIVLGLLNSKVASKMLEQMNPTMNFLVTNFKALPINQKVPKSLIIKLIKENIEISKDEWNSYETSWDFSGHPFLKHGNENIFQSFSLYKDKRNEMFKVLKSNEEELNKIYINTYGLERELIPYINDKEITLRLANREKDTKLFLSYFIGCWLGRYSLDFEGLAYAGGEWDTSRYDTFIPSEDGIVTFTDEKVLPDTQDVYERLKQFLIVIYSEETLEENLVWIAESLGKKETETVESSIRNYFIKDFEKDHIQMYQKRPIYWLIASGKQKGMQSLVYLHRYTPQTLGLAMQNHFIPLLTQWRNLVQVTEAELDSGSLSATEKREKRRLLNNYKKRSEELADFQESLNELARQEISLDLDVGVKVNYQKLASVLYPIKF
ncbi:SAM-dependent methyltransferase [Bacillus cereus]|nr:SAM-dependent methyltransferase [Bacillus cereus]PGP77249.1 SAM-dependent methyltransferase [Bacillus cereus]